MDSGRVIQGSHEASLRSNINNLERLLLGELVEVESVVDQARLFGLRRQIHNYGRAGRGSRGPDIVPLSNAATSKESENFRCHEVVELGQNSIAEDNTPDLLINGHPTMGVNKKVKHVHTVARKRKKLSTLRMMDQNILVSTSHMRSRQARHKRGTVHPSILHWRRPRYPRALAPSITPPNRCSTRPTLSHGRDA